MAEIKKILTLAGLTTYDEKIKKVITDGDAKALADAKTYADVLATNYDAAGTAQSKMEELANGQVKTNKEARESLKNACDSEVSILKEKCPDIVESWTYYKEFLKICDEAN